MKFWEKDTHIFIKDFGETILLSTGETFEGIFESPESFHEAYNSYSQKGEVPTILATAIDIDKYEIKKGTTLTVNYTNYKVKQVKKDVGFATIELEKRA